MIETNYPLVVISTSGHVKSVEELNSISSPPDRFKRWLTQNSSLTEEANFLRGEVFQMLFVLREGVENQEDLALFDYTISSLKRLLDIKEKL